MARGNRQRKKRARRNQHRREVELRVQQPRSSHVLAWVLGCVTLVGLVAAAFATTSDDNGKLADLAEKGCPLANGGSARRSSFAAPPPMCIDAHRSYRAKLYTDVGVITLALDTAKAPKAVNNFVFLARYHFFDGLAFHRVIPGFLIQGGDPKGDGSGGPGYTLSGELPRSARAYTAGALVMAKSGPNTDGSQFFIVVSDEGAKQLAEPTYPVFGRVIDGLDVVQKIAADGGPPPAGTPTTLHTMEVSIVESP